jgi:hypothetical protein
MRKQIQQAPDLFGLFVKNRPLGALLARRGVKLFLWQTGRYSGRPARLRVDAL